LQKIFLAMSCALNERERGINKINCQSWEFSARQKSNFQVSQGVEGGFTMSLVNSQRPVDYGFMSCTLQANCCGQKLLHRRLDKCFSSINFRVKLLVQLKVATWRAKFSFPDRYDKRSLYQPFKERHVYVMCNIFIMRQMPQIVLP
jgi:hypothetical protein